MATLESFLASLRPSLNPDASDKQYADKLRAAGYATKEAIAGAASAEELAQRCDIIPSEAEAIWKGARGREVRSPGDLRCSVLSCV